MKTKVNFFDLLKEQSSYVVKAMTLLHEYCTTGKEDLADIIILLEDEADEVRRKLIVQLNKTYITPIDREDLFHLSLLLDEIIDYIKTSVDEIHLFKITANEDMIKMTSSLMEMMNHLHDAISNMEHNEEASKTSAYLVKNLENVMESLTKSSYARIFENDDFKMIFKYNEIYRHLNHTADVADKAMDFLLDIFVKM